MLFWLSAALLTLAACLAVLFPVFRREIGTAPESQHDLEVYKDQLAEVDRDVERGTIDQTQAEQARAEIGRRIIKAGSLVEKSGRPSGMTASARLAITASVLAVPLVSWGFYAAIGSPDLPAQPLHARHDPSDQSVEDLVAQAERHLADNPSDGRGWDVLAPIYQRMGRHDESVTAYRNAIRLEGASADRHVGLADALAAVAGGTITTEAQAQLEAALALQADNIPARHLLATGYAQEGAFAEAAELWSGILADLPSDSPWHNVIDQAMIRAQDRQEAENLSGNGARSALENLSEEDRAEAIEQMVAGLDARLRAEPDDAQGWARLIQSYTVLGRSDEALDAYERGMAALGEDSEAGTQLTALARSLGIEAVDE